MLITSHEEYLKAFKEITDQMVDLTSRKNKDYCGSDNPFKNFEMVNSLGITDAQTAILVRMTDKISRISSLIKKSPLVADESLEDSLFDLAVYSVILMVYRKHLAAQEPLKIVFTNQPVLPLG